MHASLKSCDTSVINVSSTRVLSRSDIAKGGWAAVSGASMLDNPECVMLSPGMLSSLGCNAGMEGRLLHTALRQWHGGAWVVVVAAFMLPGLHCLSLYPTASFYSSKASACGKAFPATLTQ